MATNPHFDTYTNFVSQEQELIEDLIIESIKIHGLDVTYLPREKTLDVLYAQDVAAEFNLHFPVEMYIKSVDGFDGEGDFLSKFGVEIRDTMTLAVARRRFEHEADEINFDFETTPDRPREGDVIYFPLTRKLYEIKFVEHEPVFYQMGALQFYELRVELFEYSNERFNTGIDEIDCITSDTTTDLYYTVELLGEDGMQLFTEHGDRLLIESDPVVDLDARAKAENDYIQVESDKIIDFSETDPFSDLGVV